MRKVEATSLAGGANLFYGLKIPSSKVRPQGANGFAR